LLAVSVLAAAPALAAPYRTAHAPVIKTAPFSAKVLNANARWGRHHHHRHYLHYRHHRHHHWR
jgi:hypothetical protein